MNEREFLMKMKLELRAFEVLLDEHSPEEAYEKWKKESQFDISEILEQWIFVERKSKEELKKEIKLYCKFIDQDLMFLEHFKNLNFDDFFFSKQYES